MTAFAVYSEANAAEQPQGNEASSRRAKRQSLSRPTRKGPTNEERKRRREAREEAALYYAADGYEYANSEIIDEAGTAVHIAYYEPPREPYDPAELAAYLGDYADDYDVTAIEAEATEYDPATGRRVWTPEAVRDLWSICERHELVTFYAI